MFAGVIEKIDRFNRAHPWSHNDLYHRWVLRQLPGRMSRTIDVGCGTGNLVRAISARAEVAEGIDADPAVIAIACRSPEIQPNMIFTVADLMNVTGGGRYDAVTAIAVVHHLPLAGALAHMRSLLAPGGKIVVVGCYRLTTRTDHLVGLAAVPANMIIGYLKAGHAPEACVAMSARTAPAQTTLAEIRNGVARVLPGARIRRRLFWRYSLTFTDLGTIEPVLMPGKSRSAI